MPPNTRRGILIKALLFITKSNYFEKTLFAFVATGLVSYRTYDCWTHADPNKMPPHRIHLISPRDVLGIPLNVWDMLGDASELASFRHAEIKHMSVAIKKVWTPRAVSELMWQYDSDADFFTVFIEIAILTCHTPLAIPGQWQLCYSRHENVHYWTMYRAFFTKCFCVSLSVPEIWTAVRPVFHVRHVRPASHTAVCQLTAAHHSKTSELLSVQFLCDSRSCLDATIIRFSVHDIGSWRIHVTTYNDTFLSS